jgi:hypothetical protein
MGTKVILRKWLTQFDNLIIALFPEIPADVYGMHCTSYEHIGQHGAADYQHVIQNTNPALPREYADLLAELREIGYDDLEPVKHETPRMREKRMKAAREWRK